ncbi:MAG: cob(I)yrinic acid a,c-diamide adenosyltransferase [Candidatus Micrarchaeota archaeon]
MRLRKMGAVHVYTGDGGGKTTAALGVALRAAGWRKKTVFIQFMKGRPTGELKAARKLAPFLEIRQFGSREFVDLKNPSEADKQRAFNALECAWKALAGKPDLLVLDEANLAAAVGLVKPSEVMALARSAPEKTRVVLTGRNAPKQFIEAADFVTEVRDVKRPPAGRPVKGIEY